MLKSLIAGMLAGLLVLSMIMNAHAQEPADYPTLVIKARDMHVVKAQMEIEQAMAEADSLIKALDAADSTMQYYIMGQIKTKCSYIDASEEALEIH